MTSGLPLTSLAASLPATVPFVGPEAQERASNTPFRTRLGANESVFGPSPKAIEAIADAAQDAWKYPDPEAFELRAAIAAHHGIAPANVMIGEGIDGLLGNLARLVVAPGTPVVTSLGAYPTLNYHVTGFGGVISAEPYLDDASDLERLVAAAQRTDARLVYLANPDNPMGSWVSAARVAEMLDALPEDTVFCLDEAYVDFAPSEAIPPINVTDPRLIRMRTFSKAYGLAGARIGYAIGEVSAIAAFDRVRNHFGVNRLAQVAAHAALADTDWLAHVVSSVAGARDRIAAIAEANGRKALPSATNFVTVDCCRDGAYARSVLAELVGQGVFLRMPFVAPQDRCIRITAGAPEDIDIVAEALPKALSRASG